MSRTYLIAGNWKMNGSLDSNASLMRDLLLDCRKYTQIEMLVCPPAPYLHGVGQHIGNAPIQLGAQNLCEQEKPGAYTGEIHGGMLRDIGCTYVLVGHSERRSFYGETDAVVARKFMTAQACGLKPVLCIGETLEQRERGETERVLERQLRAVLDASGSAGFKQAVIAYEPVWAIGTGRTATADQAQAAHSYVRGVLAAADAKISGSVRLLYGGSMKADNAASLLECPDVDGGLIGGAALKAAEFLAICAAAQAQVN